MDATFTLPLFLVLLALTAFFNLADMALVAARSSALEGLRKTDSVTEAALALKMRPGLFLAAIRAGAVDHPLSGTDLHGEADGFQLAQPPDLRHVIFVGPDVRIGRHVDDAGVAAIADKLPV
jgi:hypothetical protein